jgi:hypothetical protein
VRGSVTAASAVAAATVPTGVTAAVDPAGVTAADTGIGRIARGGVNPGIGRVARGGVDARVDGLTRILARASLWICANALHLPFTNAGHPRLISQGA